MTIEAMKQALEAWDAFGENDDFDSFFLLTSRMNALRTAIEQMEKQEPVAWVNKAGFVTKDDVVSPYRYQQMEEWQRKYFAPLYTTPPAAQRQWVGLDDEEIQAIAFTAVSDNWDWLRFARAIEAKLREKNGGGK